MKTWKKFKQSLVEARESVELDEKRNKTDIPASPEMVKWIESGRAKILMSTDSTLGGHSKFVIVENPNTGSNQDKVLMFTISDPKRGRIKMFSFHGSHVSVKGAMKLAKNNKLVTGWIHNVESVELDEGLTLASDDLNAVKKTAQKLSKQSPDMTYYVVKHKERFLRGMEIPYYEVYQSVDIHMVRGRAKKVAGYGAKVDMRESVELDEADNTAAVAKQVKQAVKKYTTGKLVARSKGGKTRFIMVMSDNIDNKLRKMMADVMYPKANIKDKNNISYGNISDKIISASVDHWVKALGLKESVELGEGAMKEFWQDIHDELKKAMDKKWYREMQSSNGGQGLDNIISNTHKQLYGKGDPEPKDIADAIVAKYGRNHKEYMKLSFDMMRRNESVDEAESLHWSELDKEEREDFLQHSKMSKSLASKKWNQISRGDKAKLTKMIDKSTEGEFALVERTSPLPKSTNFSLSYSYAGKDHKFVTKLTNIGGKLDRAKKEVRFEFKSAGERTRWRKKNADVIASLEESITIFDTMHKKKKKNYREMIRGLENASSMSWGYQDAPDQKESVELGELKRDEAEVVFDFKSERTAKQFAKDVENSAVGLANKGVERYKGKYRVVITGMTTDMHKKAIGKYAHKNKGEFSHSSSEVTPKGYGPYYKESVTFPTADGSTHWLDETPANAMGGTFAGGQVGEPGAIAGIDMPLGKKKKKNPKGCEVFTVDTDTFSKCVGKKPKNKRWGKFVNTESDIGKKIRKYSLRNPNRGIIIQDETTGKQVYVRRRWNDNRLKHNKKN